MPDRLPPLPAPTVEEQAQSIKDTLSQAISDMQNLPRDRKVSLAITNAEQAALWFRDAYPDAAPAIAETVG